MRSTPPPPPQILRDVVVVLTLTRIINPWSQDRLQSLWSWGIPQEKTHTTQGGTRIYHSWRNSCLHQKHIKVKSGVSLRCARPRLVHTSHYPRLEKPTIPIATQGRLPRVYYAQYLSLRIRTTGIISQLEKKKQREKKKIKKRKKKEKKNETNETKRKRQAKGRKIREKQEKTRQENNEKRRAKKKKEAKENKEKCTLADPRNWLRMALG